MTLKVSHSILYILLIGLLTTTSQAAPPSTGPDSLVTHMLQEARTLTKSDPPRAQKLLDSAYTLSTHHQLDHLTPQITEQKGRLYLTARCFPKAIAELQKSHALYHDHPSLQYRIGYVQMEFGSIFYQMGQYQEAIHTNETALAIFEKTNGYHKNYGQAEAYKNIGDCLLKQDKPKAALQAYNSSLQIKRNMGAPAVVASGLAPVANVYMIQGRFTKADSIINTGLDIPGLAVDSEPYQKLLLMQGRLWTMQGRLADARNTLQSTYSTLYSTGQENLYLLANLAMYHLEMASNNYHKAFTYIDSGYAYAHYDSYYFDAIDFAKKGKELALLLNDTPLALAYSEKVTEEKNDFIAINNEVVKELLALGGEMQNMQAENTQLQDTTNSYSDIIDNQKGLLAASVTLIALLILIAIIFINLNKKLKNNQRDQREMNLRILAVINRTESLILSLDAQGTIMVINKPAMRFFLRWARAELKAGDNILEKLRGTNAHSAWHKSIQKSKVNNHWKEVSKFELQDKKYYYLEKFSSITHQDGSYAGLVVVSNDITKEHEFNEKITRQNTHLEKSNKAKERMLSILAHDLKDAVYSAHSLSELVLETPDEFPKEELLHLFTLLHGNFEKTKNLLDGLLDWMKAQTGALEMKKNPVNLHQLVARVFDACHSKSEAKSITLLNHVNKNIEVIADAEMLKTVLRNLVSNAIKYTEPGKGEVEVVAEVEKTKVSIHVVDNGHGISKENQLKLFQAPGQFSTLGTAKEQGTGFGLSLCQELIQLHNSKLCLASQPGVGTDFYFTLPLAQSANDDSKKPLP